MNSIEHGNKGDILFTTRHDAFKSKQNEYVEHITILSNIEQRQLISWFWENEPSMVREIVCEECPEHGEMK